MSLTTKQNVKNASVLALTLGALALGADPSEAGVIQFSDRSAWEAAVQSFLTEDFNGTTPFRLSNNTTTTVGLLDIATVVPDGSSGFTRISEGNPASTKNIDGTNFLNLQLDGTPKNSIAFEFSQPTFAWGVDYSFTGFGDAAEVAFGDFTAKFGGPNESGFIGFISDTAFTNVNFKDPSISFAAVGLDNVSFSQINPADSQNIPEPSTVLGSLLVLGFGSLMKRKSLN